MKIKRDDFWGYLFIICMMVFYSTDQWRDLRNALMYFGLLMGIIGIVFSIKMELNTLITYVAFSIIPLISFFRAHDTRILVLLIAMLCGITLEIRPVIKLMFYTKLICFIIMLAAGGYGHINGTAVHGGILIILWCCMGDRISNIQLWVMAAVYLVLSVYTGSGAFAVCTGIGLILLVLYEKFNITKMIDNIVVEFIFCISLFLNYFFAAGVGEQSIPFVGQWFPPIVNNIYLGLVRFLDVSMSYRLTLTKFSWVRFGVSIWGGNVDYRQLELGQNGYFNLDSGLIWLIQGGGILLTMGYMMLTVVLMRYLRKNQNYHLLIAGVVIALWAVNEDMLLGIGTNFLTIFMGKAVIEYITERKKLSDEHT